MTQPLHDTPLDHVLALGDDVPTGRFEVDLPTERWWWSDQAYRIHGFEPGEVVPTTAMILAHKHPDDRERVRYILEEAQRSEEPFGTVHRIVDATGRHRVVSMAGRTVAGGDHAGRVLAGYVIDLTESVKRLAGEQANESIRTAANSRRAIEQAKGIVTALLDIGDDDAFELLRHRSNTTNVPVRDVARQLVAQARIALREMPGTLDLLTRVLRGC